MKKDKGFSLIELIIVIAIMAVLIGIVAPMFVKYVEKSRRAKDVTNGDQIARAIELAFVMDENAYSTFTKFTTTQVTLEATVDGVTEKYKVYPVMVNEVGAGKDGRFTGTVDAFKDKNGKKGLYTFINEELGLRPGGDNSFINPKSNAKREGTYRPEGRNKDYTYGKVNCWRICKRVDNGAMEVWAADGGGAWGGWPVYRVWPVPDDVYTK